jgi:hypothetical protein
MADDFTGLEAEVANLTSVVDSAVALINGIAARIDAAVAASDAGDNTKLTALSASIKGEASSLADAVAANTPAEAPPVT